MHDVFCCFDATYKNETENLLLSITKNCETLIEQTHRKPEETLEFKMLKPRETFHFNPSIKTEGDWMLGLIDLEVYNSNFNITKENNKFELYTDTFDEFSFEELKDEIEEILNIPEITDNHLEDETLGPRIAETYSKLRLDKTSHDGYIILLMGYANSPFRDFESYLRIFVGLEEENIQLILKQYKEKFITYELDPGNYTIDDLQKAVYPFGDHENTLQIEYDDNNYIGADSTSQIIPVKNYDSQNPIPNLSTIIFYWYYLTGTIRTYNMYQKNYKTISPYLFFSTV